MDCPRCVDNCPSGAIKLGEESELGLQGSETLHPEYQLNTRVHYKILPKMYIAGKVYDPVAEEVIIGATCTLSGEQSATTTTYGFGDFWFECLPEGEELFNTDNSCFE